MKIDLVYFEDCPSWKQGLANLESALASDRINAEINLIRIESNEDAVKEKFLGSPSFRIDGQDLWPVERQTYHLSCRVYLIVGSLYGCPTIEMFRRKLSELNTEA